MNNFEQNFSQEQLKAFHEDGEGKEEEDYDIAKNDWLRKNWAKHTSIV